MQHLLLDALESQLRFTIHAHGTECPVRGFRSGEVKLFVDGLQLCPRRLTSARLLPSTLRFAPSGRSKQLSALRGRQWTSTTGPGPVVDPYSTQLAIPVMAPVVERDRSTARGRLQNVDRHTSQALESMGTDSRYVRCNGHVLDQAISRPVCSAHHSPP